MNEEEHKKGKLCVWRFVFFREKQEKPWKVLKKREKSHQNLFFKTHCDICFLALKNLFWPKKNLRKILCPKYENKNNKIRGWDRAQHASQRHLYVLKTDFNLASMPRREYHSSCVCVLSGGPPEGILDIAEYIVSRVVFLLFLFWT